MKNFSQIDQGLIIEYKKIFHTKVDEIKEIIHSIPNEITLSDNFVQVLRHVYQVLIHEDLISVEILMKNDLTLAASKISRSMLEIAAISSYIFKLDPLEREEKSKSFMNFDGGKKRNGKDKYEYDWLATITKSSIKDIIVDQGLDLKGIIDFAFKGDDGREIKLSLYDFLSKIVHYNPKLLKVIINIDQEKRQIYYPPAYLSVCMATAIAAMNALTQFCIVFYED